MTPLNILECAGMTALWSNAIPCFPAIPHDSHWTDVHHCLHFPDDSDRSNDPGLRGKHTPWRKETG
jgi:hypothetical protein